MTSYLLLLEFKLTKIMIGRVMGLAGSQKAAHEGLQGSSVMSDVSRPFPPRNGVCVG